MMDILRDAMRMANISLSDEALGKLAVYHALLLERNRVMDLTNVSEDEMPLRHYADCAMVLNVCPALFFKGARAVDVGTGAGLPGIPLAIARPDMRMMLIDAQKKRCDFLVDVVREADLKNVTVLHMRAEDAGRDKTLREQFDVALARAVAPLAVLLEYLLPLVKPGGSALALKGPAVHSEAPDAAMACRALGGDRVQILDAPLCDMAHTLALVEKVKKTPPQFPRKSGTPNKKPIGVKE